MSQRLSQTFLRAPSHHSRSFTSITRTPCVGLDRSNIIISTTQWPPHSRSQLQSSSRSLSSFAIVNHSGEYQREMEGRHGKQLDLAWKEGSMKHDRSKPFDPFEHYKVISAEEENDNDNMQDGKEDEEVSVEEKVSKDEDEDDETEDIDISSLTTTLDSLNDDNDPTNSTAPQYNHDGSLILPHTTRAAYTAGAPSAKPFAVISIGNSGIQHKVTPHDLIVSNKLKPVHKWSVGSTHTLSSDDDHDNGHVLLVGNVNTTCVGLPFVKGAQVDVMVEEITRDETVLVFQKKRRKNHRRKNGFRRQVTFLRVLDIRFPKEVMVGDQDGVGESSQEVGVQEENMIA